MWNLNTQNLTIEVAAGAGFGQRAELFRASDPGELADMCMDVYLRDEMTHKELEELLKELCEFLNLSHRVGEDPEYMIKKIKYGD